MASAASPPSPSSNQVWFLAAGLVLVASLWVALRCVHSDFGLLLRALRDHELRCRYLGIHTPLVKTACSHSAIRSWPLAGVFYALFTTVVAPSLVGITLATNVLIWVILGGRATIVGPALAAIIVNAATPQLSTSLPLYWQGILGLVFVLVVVLLPRGLLPEPGSGGAALYAVSRPCELRGRRLNDGTRSPFKHEGKRALCLEIRTSCSISRTCPRTSEASRLCRTSPCESGVANSLVSLGRTARGKPRLCAACRTATSAMPAQSWSAGNRSAVTRQTSIVGFGDGTQVPRSQCLREPNRRRVLKLAELEGQRAIALATRSATSSSRQRRPKS